MHSIKSYSHSAREAAFLLSGTGKVSAAARGESRDREILNRPGAGNYLPFPFSALRASGHHVPSVTWVPESEPAGDCGELDALKSPADPGPARVPATAPPGRRKRELDGPAELSVFDLSIPKLLVLALITLVVFGPHELPKIVSQAGRALRDLRRIADSTKNDLREGLGPEFAFEIEDLNPRRFANKHLGNLNGDPDPRAAAYPRAPGRPGRTRRCSRPASVLPAILTRPEYRGTPSGVRPG